MRVLALLATLSISAPRAVAVPGPAADVGGRPDVVLVLADDLGWNDLGSTGHARHRTPAIDRIAAEGMRFTQAYANAANCAPSRAAVMSGQYAPRTGVYTVGSSARGKRADRKLVPVENTRHLSSDLVTLAEALRTVGYRSAAVGKWHLGKDETGPRAQGFDLNVGGNTSGHPKSYTSPYRNPDLEDGPDGEYLTDRLFDEAIAFLREEHAAPRFLYLSTYAVHTPIQPKDEDLQRVRDRDVARGGERLRALRYAAMVEGLDRNVARLMEVVEELGHDTLVIFTSDNGGHGGVTDMRPLRGSKGSFYEGGIRVPFFVRWPGRVAAGSTCDVPVIGLDLYPTLLAVTGARRPEQTLDGTDLVPLFEGARDLEREALYWHFPAYLEASQRGAEPFRTTPVGVVRTGRWKLLEFFEDGHLELYDLVDDPGEELDRAQRAPEVAERLHTQLRTWREELDAPVPKARGRENPTEDER